MMNENQDIRWMQRFGNFNKSLSQLRKYVDKGELTELEKPGIIKLFETTFEQAWLTIKDFYEGQGESDIQGSKDTFRLAIQRGLIKDGEKWMDMIESRKLTTHTDNEETAEAVEESVVIDYFPLFEYLQETLERYQSGKQGKLDV